MRSGSFRRLSIRDCLMLSFHLGVQDINYSFVRRRFTTIEASLYTSRCTCYALTNILILSRYILKTPQSPLSPSAPISPLVPCPPCGLFARSSCASSNVRPKMSLVSLGLMIPSSYWTVSSFLSAMYSDIQQAHP